MKRFHVHVHVDDLQKNIAFYSAMFNAQPARVESDYAKWMLDDPRINFAISSRGRKVGVGHLGFQVDSEAELGELKSNAAKAEMRVLDEGKTNCCYAKSDKYWVIDPQGVAWEQFHTLADIPLFDGEQGAACGTPSTGGCCPAESATKPQEKAKACCS